MRFLALQNNTAFKEQLRDQQQSRAPHFTLAGQLSCFAAWSFCTVRDFRIMRTTDQC